MCQIVLRVEDKAVGAEGEGECTRVQRIERRKEGGVVF